MNLPFQQPKGGDPGPDYDARPMVAIRRQDRSAWWFAGGAVLAAVLLFSALEARRRGTEQAEASSSGPSSFASPEAIPELIVPVAPIDLAAISGLDQPLPQPGGSRQTRLSPLTSAHARASNPEPDYTTQPYSSGNPYLPPPAPPMLDGGANGPTGSPNQAFEDPSALAGASARKSDRVMAGRLANPAATVIQGTLINAVMETALDSTSPGQTRALVTRDVYGFDGTRLLIPRGTRLYGIYVADVAQGQNRAQIRWTRMLRPDGVSVALDSPAADPLGRAGVAARVNNHFMQRLGNALLGTASAIGSTLATSSIGNSPVVVAVPGAAQTASQTIVPSSNQIMPTLTVQQGTRITVFVQHDLDFSSVDEAP